MPRFATPDQPNAPPFMIWNLDLNEDGTTPREKSFIRLPSVLTQSCAIRFRVLIGSTASIDTVLHTNYPLDGSAYERTKFHTKRFNFNNQTELICEFRIQRPGPYQYYISYKSLDTNNAADSCEDVASDRDVAPTVERIYRDFKQHATPISYFLVDPQLTLAGQHLPLDGIVLQSVSPKWLGLMNSWSPHLAASHKTGYNMLHFIPMQQRGGSDSPYSLYNQLELSDDLFDKKLTAKQKNAKLRETLLEMTHKRHLLSVTDMVWNHTAYNSDWLSSHPEAGFNLENSPHLRSAYELDKALSDFSSNLIDYGLDRMVNSVEDVERLMQGMDEYVINPLRLWEFYAIDVEAAVNEVSDAWDDAADVHVVSSKDQEAFDSLSGDARNEWLCAYAIGNRPHTLSKRGGRTIDPLRTAAILRILLGAEGTKEDALERLRKLLDLINLPYYREYDADVAAIHKNISERVKYERLDRGSWKYGKPVDSKYQIVDPLFTTVEAADPGFSDDCLHLANNGWIWGGNPLDNFAGPQSKAYLRREVIVWGDCVKLNYGKSPSDNPWLWEHMRTYTLDMARAFHGFRIDNCHSTPIELAEYLLDEARKVNPNLYVVAELFTGSEDTDRIFVQRLGINSLIREAIQAWDSKEMSRLAHRYGGRPIGSLAVDCLGEPGFFTDDEHGGSRVHGIVAPLNASLPHAIFFDWTHDNESPAQKRTMEDALPNSAIVLMTACASGSNRGYDELYPKHLNIVHEQRHYAVLDDPLSVGIGKAKAKLNKLHSELAQYQEVHVHHEGEYVTIHRVHPVTREGVLMVAHCAFNGASEHAPFDNPKLYGTSVTSDFAFRLYSAASKSGSGNYQKQDGDGILHGLPSRLVELDPPVIQKRSDDRGQYTELQLPGGFGPGSVLVVRTKLVGFKPNLDWKIRTCADEAVSKLSLGALNVALYRCDAEERDTVGDGVYDVPGLGALTYCGLQGWYTHLRHIIPNNDLGHPLCDHLRQGYWALDYIAQRLQKYSTYYPDLALLAAWFEERWDLVKSVPNFLMPRYFALTVHTAYQALIRRALELLPGPVVSSSRFTIQLALTSVQLLGHVKSSSLRPLDANKLELSMSAGLPHFSTHHMRSWGRDVFIALDGLLLTTGRFDDARSHILAFGSTLKHGLIPNLLDSGRYPRYNARDATWFWLQAVQTYCKASKEGLSFLKAPVERRFPDGETFVEWDSDSAFSKSNTVAELIHEIMSRHASGINFREWNAGPALDTEMRDEGFDIKIGVDFEKTGFVSGGSSWNCGTWMDKMGSSEKAGIKGVPATPRDGTAIEIVGLQKSALRWITVLCKSGKFPADSIVASDGSTVMYSKWNELVQQQFEKHFWVPLDASNDATYHVNPAVVNRRGIYRDTYGSSTEWADYQFRPNISVAMVVAPELFDLDHALVCLYKIGTVLTGPMGMRTLDPADMRYRPNYDNSDDSSDPLVAHGINYHQGPEWLWLTGYFLRAQLMFYRKLVSKRSSLGPELSHALRTVYHNLHANMVNLKHHISNSSYAGLPELTNKDGSHCRDSCDTQAWSSGCMLMALDDMIQLERDVHETLAHIAE
ncbi:bifunctional 4-alpha-glucanotransferase/amylo-alpha-1,6-glucosidase [Coemansia sp. RSA 1813]|nr:bifunctional 4-alpha-glucanotransferase/amylo-alpha-1,6-glucosidase [Coemansia sp. RSA 1646]KAJ1770055.1 bifunctional 4-alpha-glucanotransferase/amylo-alpha-1,6-glucosidase [Coemansia sp. RSA 1843]KAJ2087443.1 bifunctional 4-alpha-glucanotransferase/amylo-alpha-1,6-glucosidase [Coemansia sp. RSA 986]KAJ2212433.1 bifunctional 4-alpha-glucanotransferase/amylo-alpha-1,6-glucosidase [Coemansia sp. RSA 487]KAJ2566397.1 bifunctional 4-alpha-glucanotransferase/amylo-alpha-1,6-glucosidase [Coemansia